MKTIILLAVFSVVALTSQAQSAQAYFNSSANYYVKDKKVEAMQNVRDGLAKYPNDEKLKALAEKMKQDKKEQDKKDQEQKDKKENEEKKDPEKDKEQSEQEKKEQEKKDQEKQPNKDVAQKLE